MSLVNLQPSQHSPVPSLYIAMTFATVEMQLKRLMKDFTHFQAINIHLMGLQFVVCCSCLKILKVSSTLVLVQDLFSVFDQEEKLFSIVACPMLLYVSTVSQFKWQLSILLVTLYVVLFIPVGLFLLFSLCSYLVQRNCGMIGDNHQNTAMLVEKLFIPRLFQ